MGQTDGVTSKPVFSNEISTTFGRATSQKREDFQLVFINIEQIQSFNFYAIAAQALVGDAANPAFLTLAFQRRR